MAPRIHYLSCRGKYMTVFCLVVAILYTYLLTRHVTLSARNVSDQPSPRMESIIKTPPSPPPKKHEEADTKTQANTKTQASKSNEASDIKSTHTSSGLDNKQKNLQEQRPPKPEENKVESHTATNDIKTEQPVEKKTFEKVPIPDNYTGVPCNYTLDLPLDKRQEIISSYEFPGIDNYIKDLFPHTDNQKLPEDPVFVTGFSSNHLKQGLALIYNFSMMINQNKTRTFIIYDLGLTAEEIKLVETECGCKLRSFPFDKFPDHVRKLFGFAWKPLIIQMVAKEHPFVVWMDTSIRFNTNFNIDHLIQRASTQGFLTRNGLFSIGYKTSKETFRFLNEPPCLYGKLFQTGAAFLIVYETEFIRKYIMMPWVSCALTLGCMVHRGNVLDFLQCPEKLHYFACHKFDQSVLGILLNRLFYGSLSDHIMKPDSDGFVICRECTK